MHVQLTVSQMPTKIQRVGSLACSHRWKGGRDDQNSHGNLPDEIKGRLSQFVRA